MNKVTRVLVGGFIQNMSELVVEKNNNNSIHWNFRAVSNALLFQRQLSIWTKSNHTELHLKFLDFNHKLRKVTDLQSTVENRVVVCSRSHRHAPSCQPPITFCCASLSAFTVRSLEMAKIVLNLVHIQTSKGFVFYGHCHCLLVLIVARRHLKQLYDRC